MASGVLSSGSTLIPPVQNTISAPASIARKHPSVIFCHHHQTPHETSSVHQTLLFFLDNRGKRILYPAMVHFVSGCDYRCFSDHERLYIKNRSVIAYVRSRLQLILFYDKRYDSCSGELITLFTVVLPCLVAIIISPKELTFSAFRCPP